MEGAYGKMNADAKDINEDEPWKSAKAAELDKRTTADWIEGLEVSAETKLAATTEFAADNGAATSRQSYLGNLAQVKGGGLEKYWEESEVYRCRGGNDRLAFKLLEEIGAQHVELGRKVKEIDVSASGVTIKCDDAVVVEANDVILTVPPSVWNQIKITPQLPDELKPQMGVNVKYLAHVTERFWERDKMSANATTDGMISSTWECTDGQSGRGAVLCAFSGGPAAEQCRQRW